jgi:lactoylglutathione lyase
MSVNLIALTMNTANLAQQIDFYKGLGFDLEPIKISKGSEFYRARPRVSSPGPQGILFEINLFGLQDKANSATPILQLCFSVGNLEEVFRNLTRIVGVESLLDPTDMPDGRKAIVKDPDGNSIEIIESKAR